MAASELDGNAGTELEAFLSLELPSARGICVNPSASIVTRMSFPPAADTPSRPTQCFFPIVVSSSNESGIAGASGTGGPGSVDT